MTMKLDKSFYENTSVTDVAQSLIGKVLCTLVDKQLTSGIVVETEAYSYMEKACHAFNERRTRRTNTLFCDGGTTYVYLCYGIHKLFNIVTNREEVAEAVLVRAIEPLEGVEVMLERRGHDKLTTALTSGPGKLTEALGIDLQHDRTLLTDNEIWLEDRGIDIGQIETSPRIGVAYAGSDALLPWRYSVKLNKWVSKGNNRYENLLSK